MSQNFFYLLQRTSFWKEVVYYSFKKCAQKPKCGARCFSVVKAFKSNLNSYFSTDQARNGMPIETLGEDPE